MPTSPRPDSSPPPAWQQDLLTSLHAADVLRLHAAIALHNDEASFRPDDVPTDALLAVDGGVGRGDRGRLRTVGRITAHLPTLRRAVEAGHVGFDAAAAICVTASSRRLTVGHLLQLDDHLEDLLTEPRWDADVLVDQVRDTIWALRPDDDKVAPDVADEQVTVCPSLFGGGAVQFSTTAPASFTTVVNAIDQRVAQQQLLDRSALQADDGSEETWQHNHDTIGAARAAGLLSLCRDTLAGNSVSADPAAGGTRREPLPTIHLTVDLAALAGLTDQPAAVLDRCAGGRMRMTSAGVARLVDEHGAEVRTILIDDGEVLGVGRTTRRAPGWLSDVVGMLHAGCVVPGCRNVHTDLHHTDRWADGGATDVDNLAPLCRGHHVDKDRDRVWQVDHEPGHRIRITHVATGWTTVTRSRMAGPAPPTRANAAVGAATSHPRRNRVERAARGRDPDDRQPTLLPQQTRMQQSVPEDVPF